MAITIIDPGVYGVIIPYYWGNYIVNSDGSTVTSYDVSRVTDTANKAPTFDTQHEVFTNPIVDQASQNSIGDNRNGLEDPLHLVPTLTYTYTKGYTSQHQTSKAVTTGVTQDFSYEFLGVGGSTTLSASGSFTWTDGTTEDKTTSVSDSLEAPFDIPKGKIYEEKLLFEQQQVQVPYALVVHLDGPGDEITFDTNYLGGDQVQTGSSTLFYALANGRGPVPAYKDVDWSDFYGQGPYVGDTVATYSLHGTLTIEGASTATVKIYDITSGDSQEVAAEYDAAVPVGVHRTMDDAGRTFRDTPFDDWVDGGSGADRIVFANGGEDIAHAGAGDDLIRAIGVGRSLLDGGEGNDTIRLVSTAPYGTVLGGDGDDRIRVDAPAAMLYGGAGDDRYALNGATAGGTVITDAEGANRLRINGEDPLGFERVPHSDNLYILLDGGTTYDRTRDVVWVDFFAGPDNRVGGLSAAEIAEAAATFRLPSPQPLQPTTAQFTNGASATYSRDYDRLPVDLSPFETDGRHLALEITDSGFYGAAFITPNDQVIVAFEGTNLSALDDDPIFVAAQIAADAEIYSGLIPDAYGDALEFTHVVLDAAAAHGIGAGDIFVTGHSLGAAEAQYVAAQLGLAGETFGGPGIPAAVIPTGATSRLVNYVEYGDVLGNYSANPNYLGSFLFSDSVLRFGEATYIGDPLARVALEAAGALIGPDTTPAQNAEGLLAFAALARQYHPLTTYAEDLDVVLANPSVEPRTALSGPDTLGILFA